MSDCVSCGAALRWGVTGTGKRMPVDAQPSVDGNLVLDRGAIYVLAGERLVAWRAENRPLYTSHFVTCPHAAVHRSQP